MNHPAPKPILLAAILFSLGSLARAEVLDLAPDLSPPARVVTLGEPPPPANPRWIQLRMDFDALLPARLVGWRDYSFRAAEPVMGVFRIDSSAPVRNDSFSSGNAHFNFNIDYQF
ncbi:MAG: hypothetical protein ABJF10_00185 [Chthoniobacter sp.]|uniref:hypothetical protein n=1 Tax=Chthoniobacter sp. TaxID=2510640 RepID=UPI0032A9946C